MGDLSSAFLHATGSELCQAAAADFTSCSLYNKISIYILILIEYFFMQALGVYTQLQMLQKSIYMYIIYM